MTRIVHLCLSVALLAVNGCASVPAGAPGFAGGSATHEGWRHLVAGDAASAQKSFAKAARQPSQYDTFAQFGRTLVAYEHAQHEQALTDLLSLLRFAGQPNADPWSKWLATAGTSWLHTLIYESPTWQSKVDELTPMLRAGLPWRARFEIMQVADETARRAGRADAFMQVAEMALCPQQALLVASAGYRPVLDLLNKAAPFAAARPLQISGCRVSVPPQSSLPDIMVVDAQLPVSTAGFYDIAIEYRGLGALRVDGGAWHHHGSPTAWGPHRSALHVHLSPGRHKIELRLGTYGGGADYWLAAFATTDEKPQTAPAALAAMPRDLVQPLFALSSTLVARLQGDWHEGLLQTQNLLASRSFALGLVEAGRLLESEPTRPNNVTRDNARGTWRLAVELDPMAVRARLAIAALENLEGRQREATAAALAAMTAAPQWWPAALAAADGLATEGLEDQADQALNAALKTTAGERPWACPVIEAALRRARLRDQITQVDALLARHHACDARDLGLAARFAEQGNPKKAAAAYQTAARLSATPQWIVQDHAATVAASGAGRQAIAMIEAQRQLWPREPAFPLRLANLQIQAGLSEAGRATMVQAADRFAGNSEVRQAARAMNIPLPIDSDRETGLAVIAAFLKAGHVYDAPAVFVLDRLVERIFPDGGRALLTHSIVRVQSKDALDRWGEVNVPAGAEVLTLRTVKPDLSVREPEDIFGKETVSAPELEVGDFVEWETLESIEPGAAFGGGFISQRFYFQSNEAPLQRSEYIIVAPQSLQLDVDARAGVAPPSEEKLPGGLVRRRFVAERVPQVFPERAAVAALHWIPSVRVSSGVDSTSWVGFVADRLSAISRGNPAVQSVAKTVLELAGGETASPWLRAKALVSWVTTNIEAEGGADDPASFAVARGRGNRLAVALALAKLLEVPAEPLLVRPLAVAAFDEPSYVQESMSFSDVLLRFPGLNKWNPNPALRRTDDVFVDTRLRYAPFGYLAPGLRGAAALHSQGRVAVQTMVQDVRQVRLHIAVNDDGDAVVKASEHLVGAAAIDWAEALRQLGPDEDKRRRRFEEAYLAYHFPGATLEKVNFKPGAAELELDYQLSIERFATKSPEGLTLEPRFFLAQPGRRYATEPVRKTSLLMGPDVPLDLQVTMQWPAEAKVLELGKAMDISPLGPQGPRFVEERVVDKMVSSTVVLRRRNHMDIVRVSPDRYPQLSAALRRVDSVEQAPIRVRLKASAR